MPSMLPEALSQRPHMPRSANAGSRLGGPLLACHVMAHDRFFEAARPILDGDDSIQAANALEGVVVTEYFEDE